MRVDVPLPPKWIQASQPHSRLLRLTKESAGDKGSEHAGDEPVHAQALVAQPLAEAGLVPEGWLDGVCLNMYHTGSEGLQAHFDDAQRFARPIFSLRLFSDSRLSFGTHAYGCCASPPWLHPP